METENNNQFPFRRLDPAELIGSSTHYRIQPGQIMFYYEPWQAFVITDISGEKEYSIEHYDLLPEGAPYQLINSKLVFMAAPEEIHQAVLGNIHYEIKHYLKKNKVGKVRIAPVDVVLDEGNVVQPDLFFVSIKRSSIIDRKVFGAPDFVVEVLSSNAFYDRGEKLENYAKHGVVEYWIVHPTEEYIEVYHNEEKKLKLVQKAEKDDKVVSKAIEGLVLDVGDIFEEDI